MDFKLIYTVGILLLEVTLVTPGTITLYKERKTWPDAVRFCKKSGGKLVQDIKIADIPQQITWVGRRINHGYKMIMTNGCYRIPDNINDMNIRTINGTIVRCLKECLEFSYIGINNQTCYCVNNQTLTKMFEDSFCDFLTSRLCSWSQSINLKCGGIERMSTYRYHIQGFSLPLNYTNGAYKMLCAKWKGRQNEGRLILTGCEQKLEAVCADDPDQSARQPLDWNATLSFCYGRKKDLPICEHPTDCLSGSSSSPADRHEFWVGGFGYNIVEYSSDSSDTDQGSLCGTLSQPGTEVTYLPCGQRHPFMCELRSNTVEVIVGSMVGVVIVIIVVLLGIIFARRYQRSRKSTALDVLRRGNDENQSDVNFVKNEYNFMEDPSIGTGEEGQGAGAPVSTNYDQMGLISSGPRVNNDATDNYDHVKNVNSGNNTFLDNYDHMEIRNHQATIDDNYDHMEIRNQHQTTNDNYDHMHIRNQAQTTDDNYDHMQINSLAQPATGEL